MNYHAKSEDSSLKIDKVMLNLVFGGNLIFFMAILILAKKLWRVIMNYHSKSGSYSLKIEWVIINIVFGGHFVFCQQKFAEGHYELPCKILKIWKLTELWSI